MSAEIAERGVGDYLAVLRKHKLIIASAIILGAVLAYFISQSRPKSYETSAEILLSSQLGAGADLAPVDSLQITTEIQVLQSRTVEASVIRLLGRGWSNVSSVDVANPTGTRVLRVTVRAKTAVAAQKAADAYATAYVNNRRNATDDRVSRLAAVLQPQINDAQKDVNDLDHQILDRAAALRPGADTVVLQGLQQRRDAAAGELTSLRTTLQQLRYNAAVTQGGADLLASAERPTTPASPKPKRDGLFGALLGLMVGVAIAFSRETRSDVLVNADDIETLVAPEVVLGNVPRDRQLRKNALAQNVIPESALAEAYRSLRTSIQFASLDDPVRRLLVTSPLPGEGKTSTAANLAVAMARGDRPVVLLDTDLRRPSTHKQFGLGNETGLSDVVLGEVSLEDALQPVWVGPSSKLQVLTTGPRPADIAEMLGMPQVQAIVNRLADAGNVVIIDSAPIVPVADALVISQHVDAVLMVTRPGVSQRRTTREAITLCERAGARLIGIVINATTTGGRGAVSYGYGDRRDARQPQYAAPAESSAKARSRWRGEPPYQDAS